MQDICQGAHRYFVIEGITGSVEGMTKVKLYAVLACTVCGDSTMIEHILDKEGLANLSEKGK